MDLDKLLAEEPVDTEKEKKPVKKKGKPRGGNSPVIGMNGYNLEPGDNAKFMRVNMVLFNMEKIDMKDIDAVQSRINEFFMLYASNDMKPTVAGMAMALNMDRRRLWEIKTGNKGISTPDLPPNVQDTIKKAYNLMENLWETYMNSGKLNPVSGIFLGKNNYGYQDKTEYVLTPNQQNENEYDADSIRERYIAADQQKKLTDVGNDED
jgi:hypothetical protein